MWKRLDNLFLNLDTGMTKDRYLTMCEQLGNEPNSKDMPPDINDLPELAQIAINIFNLLGDRIVGDIGYIGKDYTNLRQYMALYDINDEELCLEILSWLDSRAVKKSSEMMKKEMDKLKRKGSG